MGPVGREIRGESDSSSPGAKYCIRYKNKSGRGTAGNVHIIVERYNDVSAEEASWITWWLNERRHIK
jgi:hypothetical protein